MTVKIRFCNIRHPLSQLLTTKHVLNYKQNTKESHKSVHLTFISLQFKYKLKIELAASQYVTRAHGLNRSITYYR